MKGIKSELENARNKHLFNMHHKIKLKLDAICQEEADMNVEEFMEVYKHLNAKSNPLIEHPRKPMGNIEACFQEEIYKEWDCDQEEY
jgi:hypothetical protein